MVITLLVLGGLVGMLLGLVVLSAFSRVSVEGLTTPHQQRPARERRAHDYGELEKRPTRYPPVPPPLAPMTRTPVVLGPSPERVLPAVELSFATPSVPPVAAVKPIEPLPVSAPSREVTPATVPPPLPPKPAPAPVPRPVEKVVFEPHQEPPKQRRGSRDEKRAKVVIDAAEAIAGDDELQSLLKQGHFIPALKRYRDKHGVGLEEAKAALDAWRAKSGRNEQVAQVVKKAAQEVASDPQIVAAIRKGKVIEAIKLYRAKTGVSLQDAKEAIDTWRRHLGR
ncbi:MAG: hypothetical protein JNJ54_29770 [Myxococcaceae bacterium]|nr:hypothetical protein [Myxococcaceae bacterium]